jgi:hypothetical protein
MRALVPLLIRLGRPEKAVAALEPPMRGENDLALRFDRARATLYGGRPAAAAEELAALVKLRPADAYFALWLHIARQRNGQDDVAELHDNAGRLDQMKWPWPVVSLLPGSTDADTVGAAAGTAADEPTRRGQLCDFYLGVMRLRTAHGKLPGACLLRRSPHVRMIRRVVGRGAGAEAIRPCVGFGAKITERVTTRHHR